VNAGAITWRSLVLLAMPYRLSADYSHAVLPVVDGSFC